MVCTGLTRHYRIQESVLIQPFSGAHPPPGVWIIHHLPSRTMRALTPGGDGGVTQSLCRLSAGTSPVMPLEWPAMVIVFTANPLVPNPEDSNPYPTGRASLVHFLSAPPRAPPPALWSGHCTGPLAAGMIRGGCRTIPEARGRS